MSLDLQQAPQTITAPPRRYPQYRDSGVAWPGEVPEHWEILALKMLADLTSGETITADSIEEEGQYPVYGGNGLRGYTSAFTHDGYYALIGRQGALCGNINYAREKFWASEHAVVASPITSIVTRWLGELLRAMNLNQYSVSAAQPGLSVKTVSNLRIPVPSLPEQCAIAAYLDRETARIDALVAKKERLIALLEEKRAAMISQAVTRGLDPTAPLKDSGVSWLVQVPAHWRVERAKWLFRERDERSTSGAEELLTVSHLTGVTRRAEKNVNMFLADSLEGYKRCLPGDLVINTMWAWMGAMGVARQEGIVSPSYNVYTPIAYMDPHYLDYMVRIPLFAQEVTRYSKGVWSSRLRLYPDGFYGVLLPLPPLEEQRALATHLDMELTKLSTLANAAERSINLLNEYRAALISAAVTGQIDVREAAG